MPRRAHQNQAIFALTIKSIVCCCLFALLFLWGWYIDQRQARLHHSSEIDQILEHHLHSDPSLIHTRGWNHTHTFYPRQYVKINRLKHVEHYN